MECPRQERSSKHQSELMAKRNTLASSPEQEMLPWCTTKQSSSITNHAQSLTFQMECHLRINNRMTKTATGSKCRNTTARLIEIAYLEPLILKSMKIILEMECLKIIQEIINK